MGLLDKSGRPVKVSYPDMLDGFGRELKGMLAQLKVGSLTPATWNDILTAVGCVYSLQQLMVHMYNLNVTNYELMQKRIDELETKLAGYSERITALENRKGEKS